MVVEKNKSISRMGQGIYQTHNDFARNCSSVGQSSVDLVGVVWYKHDPFTPLFAITTNSTKLVQLISQVHS